MSEIVRRRVIKLLGNYAEIEVVGEATNFAQMLEIAERFEPEVIVVDLNLLDRAPRNFRSQRPIRLSRLVGVSLKYDVDAKLFAASVGISVLLDKADLYSELAPAILRSL